MRECETIEPFIYMVEVVCTLCEHTHIHTYTCAGVGYACVAGTLKSWFYPTEWGLEIELSSTGLATSIFHLYLLSQHKNNLEKKNLCPFLFFTCFKVKISCPIYPSYRVATPDLAHCLHMANIDHFLGLRCNSEIENEQSRHSGFDPQNYRNHQANNLLTPKTRGRPQSICGTLVPNFSVSQMKLWPS